MNCFQDKKDIIMVVEEGSDIQGNFGCILILSWKSECCSITHFDFYSRVNNGVTNVDK